ncbi:MAG: S8 family serine peptidase [Thermoleophilia bacterium]
MRRAGWLAAAAVALAAGAAHAGAGAAAPPASLTVDAKPGQVARAAAGLQRAGLRIQRRHGRALQVVADPVRARALGDLPGVAGARVASGAFGDDVAVSQGLERSGADVLGRVGGGGEGLTIAILDMGFGQGLARLQGLGELPPAARLETLSFDAASGLAGRNAYGNRTNHGEIVAQTVYDYAPNARYILANYHTEADFLVAAEALIARRPDIVVHSNSFIEGPFDGTSASARAVDRAATAGILWFNSAGNYARLHWSGPWADADADTDLDWPNGDNWSFGRGAGNPITFALSWTSPPGGPVTDLDLVLERLEPTGTWIPVAASADRQAQGSPTAERIVGYSPPADATFRLRVLRVAGPEPAGDLTLFSREIPLADIGGTVTSSIPTPGDAAGAIAVGAVDWRGNSYKSYSSQGPSDDGRIKPDLVAPTDTRIMGPEGFRAVGGTSNAAPNAAGAAAVLLAAERRAGRAPSAATIRGALVQGALDLGEPGPDGVFGFGRVRVSLTPPRIARPTPAPLAAVRGRVAVKFTALSRSRVSTWRLAVDGQPAVRNAQTYPRGITVDTRRLPDGWHQLAVEAKDFPGNVGTSVWSIRVDNTRPTLIVRRVATKRLRPARVPGRGSRPVRRRDVRFIAAIADPGTTGRMTATVTARPRRGRALPPRTVKVKQGQLVPIRVGALPAGRWRVTVDLRDRAGNAARATRSFIVR